MGLQGLSANRHVEGLVARLPGSSAAVARYVPGRDVASVVPAVQALVEDGLAVSIDWLGVPAADEDAAEAAVLGYVGQLETLHTAGLARHAEVSVKLAALGQGVPDVGPKLSLENARRIAHVARAAGTAVTLDMEDRITTDQTLETLRELRKDYPETGAVLQAALRRTEEDARALAFEGSRVRLCKGAFGEPAAEAFTDRHDIDKSFVRCLKVLMAGHGYPMVATHDPRLIRIAGALATRYGRSPGSYEFQMLYGVRPVEQRRLAAAGEQVRVYVPYGEQWYGYLVRRLAERPANLTSFVRSLVVRN
ncbi:MAG: proline dehydrogenase family protein [Propionibacteriales bacterium]|nr:proline dehydrogenase family protein [Propionibacteriales bacterium]